MVSQWQLFLQFLKNTVKRSFYPSSSAVAENVGTPAPFRTSTAAASATPVGALTCNYHLMTKLLCEPD